MYRRDRLNHLGHLRLRRGLTDPELLAGVSGIPFFQTDLATFVRSVRKFSPRNLLERREAHCQGDDPKP
jgi:hypothetical protein